MITTAQEIYSQFVCILSPTERLRSDSKLLDLLPTKQRREVLNAIFEQAGFLKSPSFGWGSGWLFAPTSIPTSQASEIFNQKLEKDGDSN